MTESTQAPEMPDASQIPVTTASKTATRGTLTSVLATIAILAILFGLWYYSTFAGQENSSTTPSVTNEVAQVSEDVAKETNDSHDDAAIETAAESVAASPEQVSAPAVVSQTDLTAYAAQVLQLVNEERRRVGVSPLLLQGNSNYVNAAQTRAREIAISYSNYRPNGSYFATVLADNGIAYSEYSENIAKEVATPSELVQRLMSYSTTRNNILSSKFGKLAVGAYSDGSAGDIYWNLLFTN